VKNCSDVMTRDPACCLPEDPITRAAQLMKQEDVGVIPVVEGGERKLVGIITDRDVVVQVVASGRDLNSATVRDAMSKELVTVRPEDDIDTAMDRMAEYQVRRIPVVDAMGGILGIISQADIAVRVNKDKKTGTMVEEISKR
jgi:CBS domain-containing protein